MLQLNPTPTPQADDVVISRLMHSATVWVLSSYQKEEQARCRTYDEAKDRAQNYARAKGVDVFYTEDEGLTFCLLARYRRA